MNQRLLWVSVTLYSIQLDPTRQLQIPIKIIMILMVIIIIMIMATGQASLAQLPSKASPSQF